MTDREKVIRSIEACTGGDCRECHYFCKVVNGDYCWDKLMKEAAELLEEQGKEIERLEHDLAITTNSLNYYINGNS